MNHFAMRLARINAQRARPMVLRTLVADYHHVGQESAGPTKAL
jgi:hypothetical protein